MSSESPIRYQIDTSNWSTQKTINVANWLAETFDRNEYTVIHSYQLSFSSESNATLCKLLWDGEQ